MNFPHRTAFAVSHKFWTVVCSFSFVSRNFLISSLISFLNHHCLIACYSISMNLSVFEFFPWFLVSSWLVSSFKALWSEKMLDMISNFLNCWGWFCVLLCSLSLKMFHVHLKRVCFLLLWDERFYIYQWSPFNLRHCSILQYLCWYCVWKIYPFLTVGC